MGFDQWATFYNHYVVRKVHWEYEIVPYVDTYGQSLLHGAYVSDDATVPTDPATMIELGSTMMYITPSTIPRVCSGDLDMPEFFGRSPQALSADSTLSSAVTTNPSDVVYLNLWLVAANAAATVQASITIRLVYTVQFMEPTDLGPSLRHLPVPKPPRLIHGDWSQPVSGPDWDRKTDCEDEAYELVRIRKA
jgi:hypothetical protein